MLGVVLALLAAAPAPLALAERLVNIGRSCRFDAPADAPLSPTSDAPRPLPECVAWRDRGATASADVAPLAALLVHDDARVRALAVYALYDYPGVVTDEATGAKLLDALAREKNLELRMMLGAIAGKLDVTATRTLPRFRALIAEYELWAMVGLVKSPLLQNNRKVGELLPLLESLIRPAASAAAATIDEEVIRQLAKVPEHQGCPQLIEALVVKDAKVQKWLRQALEACPPQG